MRLIKPLQDLVLGSLATPFSFLCYWEVGTLACRNILIAFYAKSKEDMFSVSYFAYINTMMKQFIICLFIVLLLQPFW